MITAGCDYDTRAVYVVLFDEASESRALAFALDGDDAFERTRAVSRSLPPASWWDEAGVVALGIEEPMAANPMMRQTIAKLKAIQGAVLACLPASLLVQPFNAGEWKKAVGLPGNATKAAVSRYVHEDERGDPSWTQDVCDAYCLALAVRPLVQIDGQQVFRETR